MHILVVEDDEFLSRLTRLSLEDEHYEVTVAKNGVEALEKLRSEQIDLVLLDILMPQMDGFDALKEMSEDPVLQQIPVIILSNLEQESDIARCKELGAVDYIVKANIDADDIADIVSKYKK